MVKPASAQETLFDNIRRKLFIANSLTFAVVLSGFAIAIRTVFVQALHQQFNKQLDALAQTAYAVLELEDGILKVEDYHMPTQALIAAEQSAVWYDHEGKLLAQQGEIFPEKGLKQDNTIYTFTEPVPLKTLTIPFRSVDENNAEILAHVQVSQSLAQFNQTITLFDWGLISGISVAVVLWGTGALWLNRQTMRPIEESYQRLQQFTDNAAHEFRTPLMAITSNAEVSLKYAQSMNEEDKDTLKVILNAAEQMTNLTQDLLLLARTNQVSNHRDQGTVELTSLLEELINLYRIQATNKHITLISSLQPQLKVLGDKIMLNRAFTNLLQNALRYTPNSGQVTVQAFQQENQLHISVIDTGVGITPENLEKIFDRFWRTDKARNHDSGGFGLGLAITQTIIQKHSGIIKVQSQVDQGSCFTVCLPASL